MFEYFEVYMRSGGTAAASHQGDNLILLNDITHFNDNFFVMAISGGESTSVINFHHFSIAISLPGKNNDTRCYRHDIVTLATGEIDTIVPGSFAINRVISRAKPGGHPTLLHGSPSKEYVTLQFSIDKQGLKNTQLLLSTIDIFSQLTENLEEVRGRICGAFIKLFWSTESR
jgi:hypothetical protein